MSNHSSHACLHAALVIAVPSYGACEASNIAAAMWIALPMAVPLGIDAASATNFNSTTLEKNRAGPRPVALYLLLYHSGLDI